MHEIEYKYLVNIDLWNSLIKPDPEQIIQGYISNTEDCTVRVRLKGEKSYLTIKGRTEGITRKEFEYPIPFAEAEAIISSFANKTIIKKRYEIVHEGMTWEVDVFEGKLEGLILAELEVESEETDFDLPNWVTEDVSRDPNYYNAVLIQKC